MSSLTEKQRASEFLLSEGAGSISREMGILASGQNVVDGTALIISAGKLVIATGAHHTDGSSSEDVVGLVIGNHNVAADTAVAYIARLAEVKASAVVLHSGSADSAKQAAVAGALANQFVVLR